MVMRQTVMKLGCAVFAYLLVIAVPCAAEDLFETRVAKVLQRRCVSCHSGEDPEGGVSLQRAEEVVDRNLIEVGDPDSSYLIELVTPVDGHAEMPKDGDPLTSEELDDLREWIANGAHWPEGQVLEAGAVTDFKWWSYQPMQLPAVPLADDPWVRTPIDGFVLARHREKGLVAAPEADRRTLIRRVTYDLIGLPPSPEEVEAFVADSSPNAYERLVERLLESKQYGERWARHWLDVVKYADTCGYDKDKLRPNAWPYRDYVIRSFNDDKPYSRFMAEQIAGDVLFPGEPDGILGLGFLAAGPWDFIGHVEVPEAKMDGKVARNLDRDDMVSNALNTFCSVTVQCARCHHHKFDPITQEAYYGLQSVFAAVDRADRVYDINPETQKRRQELQSSLAQYQTQLRLIDQEIDDQGGERLAELRGLVTKLESEVRLEKEEQFGYHSAISPRNDQAKWVEIDLGKQTAAAKIILHPCHDDFGGIGAGFGFPHRYRIEVASEPEQWTTIFEATSEDLPNPGLSPRQYAVSESIPNVRWVRITATKLATRSNDFIFALAEVDVIGKEGEVFSRDPGVQVRGKDSIEAPPRWAAVNLVDGRWARFSDTVKWEELQYAQEELETLLAKLRTPQWKERRTGVEEQIVQVQKELQGLPAGQMVYAAATEFAPQGNFKPTGGKPRDVFVLHRGEVMQPKEPASPGVIPLMSDDAWQFAEDLDEGQRRAALAEWLTRKDHPLVWRSIVNRVWQYHFGEGIVSSSNDFGRMGASPSHPELLDWLALNFRDSGESFKQLHRWIVLSSTYRQSSLVNPENALIDGSNQFLWQMQRRRLSAEEVRDSILSVSGALDLSMGGPGYYLFALEKTEHSPHYEYHKFDPADPKSHRRSVYRFIVRSQPDPWMTTLDCADSSQSTPKRSETLTSLQALALLNNDFILEMSRRFADRVSHDHEDLESQVCRAIELVLQREPTEEEREAWCDYGRDHGLVNVCRFLLNLSEFVFVD